MTRRALIDVPDGTTPEARVCEAAVPAKWCHASDVAPSTQPGRATLIHASGVGPPTAAVHLERTLSPNEDSR